VVTSAICLSKYEILVPIGAGTPVKLPYELLDFERRSFMHFDLLALYAGPDQVMTVTSGIASVIGVLLVFWNKLVAAFFRIIGSAPRPADPVSPAPGPQNDTPKNPS
jgi:hypothetical protein